MTRAARVTDLMGNTPLFELAQTVSGTRYFLKLEQFNPTGAAKIRMARSMIDDAEQRGVLKPGGHIIESTSGNTGLGLAVVAAERGYRFTAVVDHHASKDKLRAMQAMGTKLVYVSDSDSLATSAREDHAAELARQDPDAYFTEQHNSPANPVGYYALADELLADLPTVDVLLSAVGTGGSLFGTARRLRQLGHTPHVIGVEPVGSIAFGGKGGSYWQSGTGTPPGATIGTAVDYSLLDEGIKVSDVDAFATTRVVARKLGLLVGGSAGGTIYTALRRLHTFPSGSTVVTIVCDGGEKYLDTIFDNDWMRHHELLNPAKERGVARLLDRYNPQAK
jgi:cystathionine beta-synthase